MKKRDSDIEGELREFSAFDQVALGVFVLDHDFKVLFWNRTLEEWTGLNKGKIVGANVNEYFPEFKKPQYLHRIEDIFNGAPPAIFSSQLHGKFMPLSLPNKTTRVKQVTVSSVKTAAGGDGYRVLFVMQDVSELTRRASDYRSMHERVVKELALREEAEGEIRKLSRVVEQNPAAVMITDLTGSIEYVNPEFTEITGYSYEEAIGKPPSILKSGHTTDEEYKKLWETITAGEIWDGEFLNVKKDGSRYWESAHIAPVKDDSGAVTHFVAVKLDITERKKAEEVLRAAREEAENATAAKDKFVALVSHDMKGPLHVVRGYLEILEEGGLDPKLIKDILQEAVSTCDDMSRLIEDILNLNRIKGGEIRPKRNFICAWDMTEESIKSYRLLAKNKGVDIINEVPRYMRMHVDKELIVEVVGNLVSNAVKFSGKGDVIRLTSSDKDDHSIVVSDTGVGIEAGRIDTLFKYEEKTSTYGTAGESGTGFGLPLVKDIVVAHGGKVRLESTYGEGSAFYVSLPYRRPNMFIVDDSEIIREILKSLLEEMDVDVIEAASGEEALGRLEGMEESPVDLMLLDINMPGMSGFDVLKRVKNTSELKEIPVVIITGDDTTETRESIFRMGADDFVVKPLKGEDLIPRLRRIIG